MIRKLAALGGACVHYAPRSRQRAGLPISDRMLPCGPWPKQATPSSVRLGAMRPTKIVAWPRVPDVMLTLPNAAVAAQAEVQLRSVLAMAAMQFQRVAKETTSSGKSWEGFMPVASTSRLAYLLKGVYPSPPEAWCRPVEPFTQMPRIRYSPATLPTSQSPIVQIARKIATSPYRPVL